MPIYELMRKDERVTLLLLNQTGGIEKSRLSNMNRKNCSITGMDLC